MFRSSGRSANSSRADSADAALTTLHVILPPQLRGRMARKGRIMIRRRSGRFSKPHARLALPEEEYVLQVRRRQILVLIESLRRGPARSSRAAMAILITRRIPATAPRRCRIIHVVTFGKATRATISSPPRCVPSFWSSRAARGAIAVKMQLSVECSASLERDRCVAVAEQRVRPLAAKRCRLGSTHLIERPFAARWRTARYLFSRSILPRLRDAFRRARQRRRSSFPEKSQRARPALRAAAGRPTLSSVPRVN